MRATPALLCEFMLAGHSVPSCDLSISVSDLAPDAQDLELVQCLDVKGLWSDVKASSSCPSDDSSALPAPRKFIKKSCGYDRHSDSASPFSSVQINRALRKTLGSAIVKDEPAIWSSCAEARQASAANIAKLFLLSKPDK
jgi:hypothetical protein